MSTLKHSFGSSIFETRTRKILAVVLTIALVLSMTNIFAFAAGGGTPQPSAETTATNQEAAVGFQLGNASATVNGATLTTSGTVAATAGTDLAFSVMPQEGFEVVAVTAQLSGAPVGVTQSGGGYLINGATVVSGLVVSVSTQAKAVQAPEPVQQPAQNNAPIQLLGGGNPAATESLQLGISTNAQSFEIPSGTNLTTYFTVGASSVDGVILLVPKPAAAYAHVQFGTIDIVNVNLGELNNFSFSFGGGTVTGDFYVLTIPNASYPSGFAATVPVEYSFDNGTTPEGATIPVTGYALQAVSGTGIISGSTLGILNGGAQAQPTTSYTTTAKTNETISVAKSFVNANDGVNRPQNFPGLLSRSYGDVQTNTSATYTVSYKLALQTTGNAQQHGRVYQNGLVIEDKISGFLPGAAPTSIKVDGVEVPFTVNGTEATFSIDAKNLIKNTDGFNIPLVNRDYAVEVSFNKNAYTNKYEQERIIQNPQPVTNQARVTSTPVVGNAATTDYNAATVGISFGYNQDEPGAVNFNVQKKISVGGQTGNYDSAMQTRYGSTVDPVTFTLKDGTNTLTAVVDGSGILKFTNLTPGTTYTLAEEKNISDRFDTMSPVQVVVSELDNAGNATVKIGGTDYANKAYEVTNTANTSGNIVIDVQKQKLFQSGSAQYEPFAGRLVTLYLATDTANTTPIDSGTAGADGKVNFYDLDTTKTYKAVVLGETYYITPTNDNITVSSTENKSYTLKYESSVGSFVIGKKFVGPDGGTLSPATYSATFQLYKTDGVTPVGNPFTLTQSTGGIHVVDQPYPAGDYILKETSLVNSAVTVGGLPVGFAAYAGSDTLVTIEAGKFDVKATGSAVDGSGVFSNKSTSGQLTITNFGFDGNPLKNFSYTIKDSSSAVVATYTMSNESSKTFILPAGQYTVEQTTPANYIKLQSDAVVTVAAGTPSDNRYQVTGTGTSQTRALDANGSVQTAAFLNALLPSWQIKKVATDDNNLLVNGAVFALYKHDGSGYVDTGVRTTTTGGYAKFINLQEGSYKIVEVTPATGYASASAEATFTIDYSDYAAGTAKAITASGSIKNTRLAVAKIRMTDAAGGGIYPAGSTFTLYNEAGVPQGTATPTNAAGGYLTFTNGGNTVYMPQGKYYVMQTGMGSDNALNYVQRTEDKIGFEVKADGTIITSNDGEKYAGTDSVLAAGNNTEINITWSNLLKPSITVTKLGETNVTDKNGDPKKVPLSGVTFKIFNGNDYVTFDSNYNMTGVVPGEASGGVFNTDPNGQFKLFLIDPTKGELNINGEGDPSYEYKIKETNRPKVPGSDQTYSKLDNQQLAINVVKDGSGKYTGYTAKAGWNDESTLVNFVDPHWFNITKYGLMFKAGATDPSNADITSIHEAGANGEFEIYLYVGSGDWKTDMAANSWKKVDTVTTGSTDPSNAGGSAFTRKLTEGKYMILETRAPISGVASTPKTAWVYDGDDPKADFGGWQEQALLPDNELRFFYEIKQNSPRVIDLGLGNTGATGGGPDSTQWARLYCEKTGYTVDENGNFIPEGKLNGVLFEIYYAAKDGNGAIVKLGDPIQEVSSGSVTKIVNGVAVPDAGRFLTMYGTVGEMKAAAETKLALTGGAWDANGYKVGENYLCTEVGYIVKEVGDLPEQYAKQIGTEKYVQIPFNIPPGELSTFPNVKDAENNYIPLELPNYAGEGTLIVNKFDVDATTTSLPGAKFEVYKGVLQNPSDPNSWVAGTDKVKDAVGNDLIIAAPFSNTTFPAGVYFLKEIQAPAGYNASGTYSINGAAGVAYGTDDKIGPVKIGGNKSTTVNVLDKKYAKVTLQSLWNGLTSGTLSSKYTIEGPGYATPTVISAGSLVMDLADGTYTIKETDVVGDVSGEFSLNAKASNPGIKLVVKDGKIDTAATKLVDGSSIGANDAISVSATSLSVNHIYKGALVIKMGYVNAAGSAVNSFTPSATFKIEELDGAGNVVSGSEQYMTWSSGEAKKLLNAGNYKVTQTGVGSTDYSIDSASVYIQVGASGVVYLQNNNLVNENGGFYGTGSSYATPLTANGSAFFYNKVNLGEVKLYKMASKTATTYLAGAQYDVYTKSGQTYTKVTPAPVITDVSGVSTLNIAPGTYYIKENTAPAGYSLNTEYLEINVTANKSANFKGYENTANRNAIGILNAKLADLKVVKKTTYPAIKDTHGQTIVPADVKTVAQLPVTLWKQDGASWVKVENAVTSFDPHGYYTFKNLEVGTYRVTEELPSDDTLDYLRLNDKFATSGSGAASQPGANTFDIVVSNSPSSDTLQVSSSNTTEFKPSTSTENALVTINNEFIGALFAAKKVDYDTGLPLAGAKFELYKNYDSGTGQVSDKVASEVVSGTDGWAYFTPQYISGTDNGIYYIKETAAPTGYMINAYYDSDIKQVVATTQGAATSQWAEFKNKTSTDTSTIGISKGYQPLASDVKPLRTEGLTVNYGLTLTAATNTLPLTNYTVVDNSFGFKGTDGNAITGTNQPTYKVQSVTIAPTTAKLTAEGTQQAIYASVNGVWKKLSATDDTKFDMSPGGSQGITIIYSNTIPASGETPTVGTNFTPGQVTVEVEYDSFKPADPYATDPAGTLQCEVQKLTNKASVSATGLSTKESSTEVTLPVDKRAPMSITKSTTTVGKVNPGGTLDYVITLKNESADTSIPNPVIVDYMQKDTLKIVPNSYVISGAAANSDATYSTYNGGQVAEWAFSNFVLGPGQSITVKFKAQLAMVITTGDDVTNIAYGTSAAERSYTKAYPYGSAFIAYPGVATINPGYAACAAEYAEISGLTGIDGLYVKSALKTTSVGRSGLVGVQKSISNNGTDWVSSEDEASAATFKPGGTMYYRLQLKNDTPEGSPTTAANITFKDMLPATGDTRVGGSTPRGTTWTQELLNALGSPTNLVVTKNGTPLNAGADYTATVNSGSVEIQFASTIKLEPSDLIEATFRVALPSQTTFDASMTAGDDGLYKNVATSSAAALLAKNSFVPEFTWSGVHLTNIESNIVSAKIVADPVKISGIAWDDLNSDNVKDPTEPLKQHVPVLLYISHDGGATWTHETGTHVITDSNGYYEFTNLESGYGYNGKLMYKVGFINTAPYTAEFSDSARQAAAIWHAIHVLNLSMAASEGQTSGAVLYGNASGGIYDCGITAKALTVTYVANDSTTNPATGMPDPLVKNERSGNTHTVAGNPSRSGYTFAGWKVTGVSEVVDTVEQNPLMGQTYMGGESFGMVKHNIVLTAQWTVNNGNISATGYSGVYDAASHAVSVTGSDLLSSDTVKYIVDGVEVSNSFKDVTNKTVTVEVWRDGVKIWTNDVSVVITPAPLTIATNTASKAYDGAPLLGSAAGGSVTGLVGGETVGFTLTGSQTVVGSSSNTFNTNNELVWADGINTYTAKSTNYYVSSTTIGTLTVTQSTGAAVITVTGGTSTYNGLPHGATVTVSLPAGYSYDPAPSSSASATDVSESGIEADCDDITIRDMNGTIVYQKVNGVETVASALSGLTVARGDNAKIIITPAPLTINTQGAEKLFDALPLTAPGTLSGLVTVGGVTETASFGATGSQTAVGSSLNTYSLVWDGTAKSGNYSIASETRGTLTVNPYDKSNGEITITTRGGNWVYDGQNHGAIVTINVPAALAGKYSFEQYASSANATNATIGVNGQIAPVAATCDQLVIMANGVDVTQDLIDAGYINFIDDTISISRRPVAVVTDSATKTFDGTPLTADGRITGLVPGETVNFGVTGSQTGVGTSQNTYSLRWTGTAQPGNYLLTETVGTLTVNPAPVIPVIPGPLGFVTVVTDTLQGAVSTVLPPTTTIDDQGTPLAAAQWCWVHWYIILGIIVTAAYSVVVIIHRRRFTNLLKDMEDDITNPKDPAPQGGAQGAPAGQGTGA